LQQKKHFFVIAVTFQYNLFRNFDVVVRLFGGFSCDRRKSAVANSAVWI